MRTIRALEFKTARLEERLDDATREIKRQDAVIDARATVYHVNQNHDALANRIGEIAKRVERCEEGRTKIVTKKVIIVGHK